MARFTREAQVLAALNHPNIAAIYGVEERALVMELVEGPTLAERIEHGAIPLDEALPIAKQIAEALEYAHERGVIHRDLKPANIKITPEGRVKVLDFGLAKALASEPIAANPAASPTLTMRATVAGVILGTAAYMSPEQARGQQVDKRSDIWSFGVVLHEMLTGRALFHAPTVSDTLAAVLRADLDWSALPADLPPNIRTMLRRSLERDPKRRLRDIGDARLELEQPAPQQTPVMQPARRPGRIAWIAATAVFAIAAVALALVHFRESPAPAQRIRFSLSPPEKVSLGAWMQMSPDGRHLGFISTGGDGISRVWLRSLDALEARPLAGTEETPITFFWSPDSHFVAFQSGSKLKKIDISGGPPQILCDVSGVILGGSWNREGVILFGSNSGPIMRVPEGGGSAVPVTKVETSGGEGYHTDPTFLPDGRRFLYRRSADAERGGVYAGSLELKPEEQSLKRIQPTGFSPGYAPPRPPWPGYLLFLREGALMAQAFDERRLETVGDAIPIAEQVGTSITRAFFSVSANGVLAYRPGGAASSQLTWFDRQGHALGQAGEPADYQDVALSPDATRAAYNLPSRGDRQIWILHIPRRINSLLTFAPESAQSPSWSPDGKRLAFGSIRGQTDLYIQDANNSGTERSVFHSASGKFLNDWSRDGRFLLYTENGAGSGFDIWALPDPSGSGDRKPIPFATTKFNETQGQFSPDTHWVAYASDESGRYEIYVRPFAPDDVRAGKWLVSSAGGLQPRWRGDGKELFYFAPDRKLMAVDIQTEPTFRRGTPHALFDSQLFGNSTTSFRYDVTRDGKRFLMVVPATGMGSAPMTVVLNWQEGLKR